MRDDRISGPDGERMTANSFAWLEMGGLFTDENGAPKYFVHRKAHEPLLSLYRYDDTKARYVGPYSLDVFHNDGAGAKHLIGIYETEQGDHLYFGADISDIEQSNGGELRGYFADMEKMKAAGNWIEVAAYHKAASLSTGFSLRARLASADESKTIIDRAAPLRMARSSNEDQPKQTARSTRGDRSAAEIQAEIDKIDENIARIDSDIKGWCDELRKSCGGRICDRTEDGRRIYQSVLGIVWYFEDGSVAPQELWKDSYSRCYN